MAPWEDLPDHIDSPEEWAGKDDDQHWYTAWRKKLKGWFFYRPGRFFRKWPITVLAFFGKGSVRFENDWFAVRGPAESIGWHDSASNEFYLSRVQYFCRWHFQLQWPLFIAAHFYWNAEDVASYPIKSKLKGWMLYAGVKRDTDGYWFPAIYIGTSFK